MAESNAKNAMIAGIASIPLGMLGMFCGPGLLMGGVAGILGVVWGLGELSAIKAGDLPEDGKMPAMVGVAAGGFGCLSQIAMFVSIFGLAFLFGVLGALG